MLIAYQSTWYTARVQCIKKLSFQAWAKKEQVWKWEISLILSTWVKGPCKTFRAVLSKRNVTQATSII